LITLTAGISCS